MAQRGRPCRYTKAIADRICERLAAGETLRAICRDPKFPPESTVRRWAWADVNGFAARFTRARDIGLESIHDEVLEIADDSSKDFIEIEQNGKTRRVVDYEHVNRSRLRVEARMRFLENMAPNRYGRRSKEEKSGNDDAMKELADAIRNSPKE